MKAKILLTILALSSPLSAQPQQSYGWQSLGQVPQGINYQAIARDNKGDPITGVTMQVRLSILSDTITPVTVWEELHSTVKTNAFGLFTTVLGTGARQSGSALTFSDIDWTKTPLYLRTWIYYPSSWKYLGTSKIWSVPYSFVAGGLDGALDKLEVQGDDITSDEALFEVKRKDGETMFAVYNHGVRVYMPLDTMSKARKGGFAIGGFDRAKGTVQDYFVVNPDSIRAYIDPNSGKARKGGFAIGSFSRAKEDIQKYFTVSSDSVRIYIDDNLSKANKGGFAIGSFDRAKAGNASFFNVAPDSTGRIYPSQNRIQWYPLKNAFLTGKIIAENKDSIGENSFASGYESRAKGQYSQALGYQAVAKNDYSTAIGYQAVARGANSISIGYQSIAHDSSSFAFGQWASSLNKESYAFGRGAIAKGYRSFSFGSAGIDSQGKWIDVPIASGDYSFAIGAGARAVGDGALSLGNSLSEGIVSLAIGDNVHALGDCSTAIGLDTKATGIYSTAIGMDAEASNWHTMALGWNATVSGDCALGFGSSILASGDYSAAFGWYAKSEGLYSTSIGSSVAQGDFSTAIGDNAKATGRFGLSMGNSTASGQMSVAIGGYLAIASGNKSVAFGESTLASGEGSVALGNNTQAPSGFETAFGRYNTLYTPISITGWNATDRLFVIGNGSYASRSDALIILKNGNTGIGTSTPLRTLHISSKSLSNEFILEVQDGLSNWKKWNFVVNGGTGNPQDMHLRILNDAGTEGMIHSMTWSHSGNIGIGSSLPLARLEVNLANPDGWSGNLKALRILSPDNGYFLDMNTFIIAPGNTGYTFSPNGNTGLTISTPGYAGIGRTPVTNRLEVEGNASKTTAGSWLANSDARIKMQIQDIENAQEIILKLHPVKFMYTEEWRRRNPSINDRFYYNFIAQEFREVFPESVQGSGECLEGEAEEILQLDSYNAQIVTVKALQELIQQNRDQQQQLESCKSENDYLKSQIKSLREEVAQIKEILSGSGVK